ncbi:hypothetical protein FD09_GL001152 [Schleiferilactobacillus perolens DSM 12744]|uniref:LXG domain-containing protein n=1 Tax=Schleiferilactobacillus perolens DSM 12744 TaxID=1423792 RepID=A0A0R1MXA7_9LACO|nr:hypothetical protein FD09_GL001152 [Schleiferilactobacillus perolens DSM 12744]
MPHIIDDQQDAWANYEKSSEELTKNADLLLQDIGHVISQYMGQPAVRMNGYVAGSFRQMLGAKLLADTAQVSQVDQDNVHLMGQYAKLLKDQWKSHVAYVKKVLQAKKEEMKKQGWVNLLFEAVVTAVAVGAAVAAAVAMGPLVAGIAVAATALFPVSRMIGEYHQATTGEDGDRYDFIKNGFVYAFGKSNGEIAYQVADIGLSIVGSTSALNEFSKVFGVASAKELKIGGLSFVKSVLSAETSGEVKSIVISKSKDILSNARNNIKATWTSKVTVHSLFEGADQTTVLNNASKSMADNFKLVTAAKGDFSQMGEVFKSIRSANSILHNPVIKEHAARKEVIQTITKSFGEAYGKETLKKGAEKAADQYVIDPLLEKGLGIPEEPTSVSGKFVQYAGEKWGKKFGEGVFNLGKTDIITHNPFVRSVLEGAH